MSVHLSRAITEAIEPNVLLYFGDRGRAWLRDLPEVLSEAERKWNLHLLDPFPSLSINAVLPALREDGTAVVLKAGVPNREIELEVESLQFFAGEGSVHLLDADLPNGLILLDRIFPGTSALQCDDDQAVEAFVEVSKRPRHRLPHDHNFPTLQNWFEGFATYRQRFNRVGGPLPPQIFSRAEDIATELLASTEEEVLLHGDLHHANLLLSTEQSWVAIDPKGVVGDPLFEVVPFLRNPMPRLLKLETKNVLQHRLAIINEHLGYDIERMIRWGIAESILSAIWDIDDVAEGWRRGVQVAEVLVGL
ncbi:MAG: phosphotransferase [Ignavibacteriae bacterium]|nr:phosphotransferase [Ignavibacteriota bacterium]MCB9215280.1 phosphotransferase [Ignavibacteria bacterium]